MSLRGFDRGKLYGRLIIQRDNDEDAFRITIFCPKCSTEGHGHQTVLNSSKNKPFRLGSRIVGNKIVSTVQCEWCASGIELTPEEAKLLTLKFEEFKKWYAQLPEEWDGTWKKTGLFKKEE
jgi:hypothetical protein